MYLFTSDENIPVLCTTCSRLVTSNVFDIIQDYDFAVMKTIEANGQLTLFEVIVLKTLIVSMNRKHIMLLGVTVSQHTDVIEFPLSNLGADKVEQFLKN